MGRNRCEWCDRPDCDLRHCKHCGEPQEWEICSGCGCCEFCCAYAVDHCPMRDAEDEDEPDDEPQEENGKTR